MILIKPSEMLRADAARNSYTDPRAWLLYDHFANKCVEWMATRDGRDCYEVMIDTSGVGFWYIEKITEMSGPQRRLALLFSDVGSNFHRGEFLRFCGIKRWSDLDKPIKFFCRLPKDFGRNKWFDVAHRRLNHVPNGYHPDATWVHQGQIVFCVGTRRWHYHLNYSYEWEPASWTISIAQNRNESMQGFAKRVDRFIDDSLEPELAFHGSDSRYRLLRRRRAITSAIKTLFYDGVDPEFREKLIRLAMARKSIDGILPLSGSQKRTLLRWFKENKC